MATHNYGILANVHKRTNLCCGHHGALADEDMIANVHGKEGDAFAELFVGRTYHRVLANNTVSSTADIRQVATYYGSTLHNHFAIEYNIL